MLYAILLYVIGFLYLIIEMNKAPLGYEDEQGFHTINE